MKVLLVGVNSKYIHTALAVQYIYGCCTDFDVEKLEFNINQEISHTYGEIIKRKPDVVMFSTYIWNIDYIERLTSDISKVSKAIVVWGGIESSFDTEEFFEKNPGLDIIIRDEGELTTPALLSAIEEKTPLSDVEGITFRENGNIITNPPRPLIRNLDEIPSPFKDYKNPPGKIVYYEMSRGCPFKCTFCMSSTIKGVRYFSKERIESDLLYIINSGATIVKLVDRTFNANERESMDMMNFIVEHAHEGMVFHMELMAHLISDKFLEFLSTLPKGLFQFEIGVQSSNPETLKAIERVTDLERLKYVVSKIRSYGNIHQHVDQIAGLPYEDYESFGHSFDFIYGLGAEKHQLGFLKVLRGSKMKADAAKYGIVYSEYPPYEVLKTNYINEFEIMRIKIIEDLVEKFSNEDYFSNTLDYLLKDERPFKFFEDMAIYWEKNGYHKVGHSRVDLYKKLYDFLKERDDIDEITELLRLDFFINNRSNPADYLKPRFVKLEKFHDFLNIESVRDEFSLDMSRPTKFLVKDFRFHRFFFEKEERVFGFYYTDGDTISKDVTDFIEGGDIIED